MVSWGHILSDNIIRVHYIIFPSLFSQQQPLGILYQTGEDWYYPPAEFKLFERNNSVIVS